MFDPREVKVQLALGTYPEQWLRFSHRGAYDPDNFPEMLDAHLPKWDLWSEGNYRVWATDTHIIRLEHELNDIGTFIHVTPPSPLYRQKIVPSLPHLIDSKYLF